jgi:molybdenum cofactor biosynthesis enzyme MoaA
MERYINIVDYHQRKNNNQIIFDKQAKKLSMCQNPWNKLVINQFGAAYICSSPAWLPKSIGSLLDYDDFFSLLNSYEAREIRSEVALKRYGYCNHKICGHFWGPVMISADSIIEPPSAETFEFLTEEEFTTNSSVDKLPSEICFDFDYTCNFKCPSCRTEMINHNQGPMVETNKKIVSKIKHVILDRYIDSKKSLTIRWAGGEPFISHAYLDIWQYIVDKNITGINNIIQTNGSYFKKRSGLLEKFLPHIRILRVSFDAGTAETYSKIRINGEWETLIDNCKYVRKLIDQFKINTTLESDFVVQLDNFQEIPRYIDIAKSIGFDQINLSKMWNWDTWPMQKFKELNISSNTHPRHQELVEILKSYASDPIVLNTIT